TNARARTTEGRELLTRSADSHLGDDAQLATTLASRGASPGDVTPIDDQDDDELARLDAWARAGRADSDARTDATVVVDPLTAPEGIGARDFDVHRDAASGRLMATIDTPPGIGTGIVWVRI